MTVAGSGLRAVLTKAENWLWSPHTPSQFRLSAPRLVREQWFDDAYPTADSSDLPRWDELDVGQREVLVCAAEASGMLTGPFGIWDGPPAELDATQRLDWVDRHLAALLPFVRDGWIRGTPLLRGCQRRIHGDRRRRSARHSDQSHPLVQ